MEELTEESKLILQAIRDYADKETLKLKEDNERLMRVLFVYKEEVCELFFELKNEKLKNDGFIHKSKMGNFSDVFYSKEDAEKYFNPIIHEAIYKLIKEPT